LSECEYFELFQRALALDTTAQRFFRIMAKAVQDSGSFVGILKKLASYLFEKHLTALHVDRASVNIKTFYVLNAT
jgi:hypothetical protein